MLSKKGQSDRFSKVIQKLNTPQERSETPKSNEQSSFLHDFTARSQKSTKYGSQIEARSTSASQQIDQSKAIKILLEEPEVLINKQVTRLKTQFLPTSNGMRFLILIRNTIINLSWIHSIKQIEPGKLLLIYYDLSELLERKGKMQSVVLQVGRTQGSNLFMALNLMHTKYHDDEIQKLYHYLC